MASIRSGISKIRTRFGDVLNLKIQPWKASSDLLRISEDREKEKLVEKLDVKK